MAILKLSDLPLQSLGPLPRDEAGPVFAEPWQAEAFALVLRLHEAGLFAWSEWAAALAAELDASRALGQHGPGGPNDGGAYYERWLAALQNLLAAKDIVSPGELESMRHAWEEAYAHTPHGQPVKLKA
jgi:nitrile hydratase accessory protein